MASEANDLIEKNSMAWVSIWATIFFFRKQMSANKDAIDNSGSDENSIEIIEFESAPVLTIPN